MAKEIYPDWRDYEKQIFSTIKEEFPEANVTFNESIKGAKSSTHRQIDVSIRFKEGSKSILGIVECKYFGRRVDIGKIDALLGKMLDLNASFALIFTHLGFTNGAEQFAAKVGIGFRKIPFEYLKDFGYVAANELEDVFMQEISYNKIYCEKCQKLNLYEIKIVRGFADFNEAIICPQCKTPHETSVRTDGGYKVIKRFDKKTLSEKELNDTIVGHILLTRIEWDKRNTCLWDDFDKLPKERLCFICYKELNQGFPGSMTADYKGHKICFECMMSSRTLLIDYKKVF